MLSDLNFNILRASNGQEAVDRVMSGEKIDLILMDIKMPVMNGFEASMRIKKSHPHIPIIAQTAYAHESDKNKAFECGCDAYIIKPIRKDVILSVIKEKLERVSPG